MIISTRAFNSVTRDGGEGDPQTDWTQWDGWLPRMSVLIHAHSLAHCVSVVIVFAILLGGSALAYIFYFNRYGCGAAAWCRFCRKRHPEKYDLGYISNKEAEEREIARG